MPITYDTHCHCHPNIPTSIIHPPCLDQNAGNLSAHWSENQCQSVVHLKALRMDLPWHCCNTASLASQNNLSPWLLDFLRNQNWRVVAQPRINDLLQSSALKINRTLTFATKTQRPQRLRLPRKHTCSIMCAIPCSSGSCSCPLQAHNFC